MRKYKIVIDIERSECYNYRCLQSWRNWHTRMIQVHVHVRGCGFKSHRLHESFRLRRLFFCRLRAFLGWLHGLAVKFVGSALSVGLHGLVVKFVGSALFWGASWVGGGSFEMTCFVFGTLPRAYVTLLRQTRSFGAQTCLRRVS